MGLRREGRELALQMLYAQETLRGDIRNTLRAFREAAEAEQPERDFAESLVYGVQNHISEIDAAIKSRSKNWSLSRMPRVDLAIMRLAAYELMFMPEIPKKVTINEAIEIAKKFGDKESPSFVNGILDELDACEKEKERSDT